VVSFTHIPAASLPCKDFSLQLVGYHCRHGPFPMLCVPYSFLPDLSPAPCTRFLHPCSADLAAIMDSLDCSNASGLSSLACWVLPLRSPAACRLRTHSQLPCFSLQVICELNALDLASEDEVPISYVHGLFSFSVSAPATFTLSSHHFFHP
jgi:hypothetical protein